MTRLSYKLLLFIVKTGPIMNRTFPILCQPVGVRYGLPEADNVFSLMPEQRLFLTRNINNRYEHHLRS